MAIFLSALLDEEEAFKRKIVGSLSQINYEVFLDHCAVSKDKALPFSNFVAIMQEMSKKKYNLRSALNDYTFQARLSELCNRCEDFIFVKLQSQAEKDKEEETKIGNL